MADQGKKSAANLVENTMGGLNGLYHTIQSIDATATVLTIPSGINNTPAHIIVENKGETTIYVSFDEDATDITIPSAGDWGEKGVAIIERKSSKYYCGLFNTSIVLKRESGASAEDVYIEIR